MRWFPHDELQCKGQCPFLRGKMHLQREIAEFVEPVLPALSEMFPGIRFVTRREPRRGLELVDGILLSEMFTTCKIVFPDANQSETLFSNFEERLLELLENKIPESKPLKLSHAYVLALLSILSGNHLKLNQVFNRLKKRGQKLPQCLLSYLVQEAYSQPSDGFKDIAATLAEFGASFELPLTPGRNSPIEVSLRHFLRSLEKPEKQVFFTLLKAGYRSSKINVKSFYCLDIAYNDCMEAFAKFPLTLEILWELKANQLPLELVVYSYGRSVVADEKTVRSLQKLCRKTILNSLPVGFVQRKRAIDSLNLPLKLANFLNFSDLEF